jgi:MFS family permease
VITKAQRSSVYRLAAARLISMTGSGASWIALAYILFHLTGRSSVWVAWTFLLTFGVQGVLAPLASALGDRFDRRRVLVITDLVAAAGYVGLAFMRTPGQLLAMAFVTAAIESPIWAVSAAAIPNLVSEDEPRDLTWANGAVAFSRNVGQFAGPLLGGVLVALAAPGSTPAQLRVAAFVVFGLNALSFLVSAWFVGSTPGRFNGDRKDADEYRGIRAGFTFMARDRVLRALTFGWVVLLLGAGTTIIAEVALSDAFHSGAFGYGLFSAMWGGGAALGSVLAQWKLRARDEAYAVIGGVAFVALGLGLVAVAPWLGLAVALVGVAGLGEGFGGVGEQAIIQRRTPDEVRSRVMGATEAAVLLALAVSFAIGGAIVEAVGPRWAYALAGLSTTLALAIIVRPLREDAELQHGPRRAG